MTHPSSARRAGHPTEEGVCLNVAGPPRDGRHARRWLGVFAVLFILGLGVGWPGLDNGWFFDDLIAMRSYSLAEQEQGLTHTWNPDPGAIPAWRPLLTPTIDTLYSLFGEDRAAHRVAMIAALAAALTLFAAALAVVGVPPWLTVPAAALELTAKNSVYALTWITNGYQNFQAVAFGAALLAVALASRSRAPRHGLLVVALVLWCITLLLKDQAVVLLPIIAGLPIGARLIADAGLAPGYRGILADLRTAVRATWRRRDLTWFVSSAVGVAALDLVLRRVFVPSAPSELGQHSLDQLGDQARFVVEFAGDDRAPAAYLAVAALAVAVVAAWPLLAGKRTDPLAANIWRIALLAGCASLSAMAFALVKPRSDLVLYPLFLYALFLCATASLVWRLVKPSWRVPAAIAAISVAAVSLTASIGASREVQRAMSPWSLQTLDLNYQYLLGTWAHPLNRVSIPAGRRADELARLRAAGVNGYVGQQAGETLLCAARERASRGLPQRLLVPSEYFLGEHGYDAYPEPDCGSIKRASSPIARRSHRGSR
jgi:hypothetical protein